MTTEKQEGVSEKQAIAWYEKWKWASFLEESPNGHESLEYFVAQRAYAKGLADGMERAAKICADRGGVCKTIKQDYIAAIYKDAADKIRKAIGELNEK